MDFFGPFETLFLSYLGIFQSNANILLAFLSYSQANFVAHDVASDNSNDDTIIDDTMTNSETMLEPTVLDDPLFHSMSVIEGSEKR